MTMKKVTVKRSKTKSKVKFQVPAPSSVIEVPIPSRSSSPSPDVDPPSSPPSTAVVVSPLPSISSTESHLQPKHSHRRYHRRGSKAPSMFFLSGLDETKGGLAALLQASLPYHQLRRDSLRSIDFELCSIKKSP